MTELKAPFPYFGGKRRAAPIIWEALGDPAGYVEPFAGSLAVLLARPEFTGRRVETVNDMDGWLVNTWRAIQLDPSGVAAHAWGPVTEIDYHARLAWLQARRGDGLVSWLEGDPEAHDAKAAGWWLYVMACGIGDPFGSGPWVVVDGRLVKSPSGGGVNRELPHMGTAGQGINRALPHLGDADRGVAREIPHLGNAGRGVQRGSGGTDNLAAYLSRLAARLQRVRITCGSWDRVVQPSVHRAGAGGDGTRAVFLDPPYTTSPDLYAAGGDGVSADVQSWCLSAPPELRVVLAGYAGEHDALERVGWRVVQGKSGGGSGYSTDAAAGRRERLWMSPSCLGQPGLW